MENYGGILIRGEKPVADGRSVLVFSDVTKCTELQVRLSEFLHVCAPMKSPFRLII